MRRPYTKPNSHSQKEASRVVATTSEVCNRARITRDQWIRILFEAGCIWAERNIMQPEKCLSMLTDPTQGYWAWFIQVFTKDDAELIVNGYGLSAGRYQQLKDELIEDLGKKTEQ